MLERLTNENHAQVVEEHLAAIAPALRRLDAAIAAAAAGERSEAELLRTMRVYLASGLFDADYYLRTYPDVREAGVDPLDHFVRHGEAESRRPNPIVWPNYSLEDIFILSVPPRREFEAAGRGDQHALMRVKRALRQLLGREEAFHCYRLVAGLPDRQRILPKRIGSLREAAAVCHGAYHEIAPGGARFRVALPYLLGERAPRGIEAKSRPAFVACLINARLRGRGAAVEIGDGVFFDFENGERTDAADQLDFDLPVFEADDEAAWVIAPEDAAETSEIDEAFSLIGPHTDGFAYWLWEYLPKYIVAVEARALPPVPVLIDADMPKAHREALALVLPPGIGIIEQPAFAPVLVRRLWCAPSLAYVPVLAERRRRFRWERLLAPPDRAAVLFGEMARRIDRDGHAAGDVEKLFLGHREFRHRRPHTARAIEAAAAERGFRVVYADELAFAEQMHAVRAARSILCPESPALFLALLARPGTRLCILCGPETEALGVVTAPLDEIGVETTVLSGPYVTIANEIPVANEYRDGALYQIDETRLGALLDNGVGGASAGASPSPTSVSAPKRRAPTIGAFVTTKDDAEIIARTIEHHRQIGIGPMVVCDVNSTDGTFEILQRHSRSSDFRVIRIVEPDRPELHVAEGLEILTRLGAHWIVFAAADELYIPASGRIEDCSGLGDCDLLLVDRYNVPIGPKGPLMPEHLRPERYDELLLVTEPIANFPEYLAKYRHQPWILGVDAPAPVARPARIGGVTDGIHDIIAAGREPLRWSRPADLVIAHLPFSTRARFARKVDNIRHFAAVHAAEEGFSLPPHWRRWLAMADEGRLEEEFDRSVFDSDMLAGLRRTGIVHSAAEILGNAAEGRPRRTWEAR